MKIKFAVPILMVTVLAGIAAAYATLAQVKQNSEPNQPLKSAVKNADFIFQGVVTKVESRLSDPSSKGGSQLPYTYVTYKIDKLLKGQNTQQFVTLRFLGGSDGKGNILQLSDAPLFDVGDKDILFVSKNGKSVCPLVECEKGRFRLINDGVFDNLGTPLLLKNQQEFVSGKRVLLPEVLTNRVGSHMVEYDVSGNETEQVERKSAVQTRQDLPPVKPEQFESLIGDRIEQLIQSRELQVQPIVSVDIREKVFSPLAEPARPPAGDPNASKPASTEAERQEMELEARQEPQSRPVIKQPRQ